MLTKFVPYLKFAPYAGMGLFAILAAVQWQSAQHWSKVALNERAAYTAIKTAQVAAQELNKAKVAEIERQYATISEKAESDYEKRIADNRRAVADFMRSQAAKRVASSTGASIAAPVPGEVVSGTKTAIVPVTDLEIVADAYAQLDALRAWALDVGKVK